MPLRCWINWKRVEEGGHGSARRDIKWGGRRKNIGVENSGKSAGGKWEQEKVLGTSGGRAQTLARRLYYWEKSASIQEKKT